MANKKQTIKINEAVLRDLITTVIKENVDEAWYNDKDDFKKAAKKVGKGIAKGVAGTALAGAATIGGAYCLDQGLQQQERYENYLNASARQMSGPTNDEIEQFCIDHNMDPNNSSNWEEAQEYLQGQIDDEYNSQYGEMNENKMTEKKLKAIIRESVINALKG